jgi:tripartite-type tricarboxylate transporter receptor subunit TctC
VLYCAPEENLIMRCVLALLFVFAAGIAGAQPYPSQPVRIIAPAPPGSPVDIRARWVAQQLAPVLGQPVLVDNKPGAGGNIGAEAAAKSAPDGHTLVVVHQGIVSVNPHLYSRTGFDPLKDFAPVTRIVDTTLLLLVPQSSPARSVADLVRAAREKPGKLSYSSSGVGTPPHLAAALFLRLAGIEVAHIPYKGATPSLTDLLAARVDFSIDSPSSHGPHVTSGKLRALAATGAERLSAFPDVPTMAEAGVAGYVYHAWIGLLAPAGTPRHVVERLNGELVRVLRTPAAREWLGAQGGVAVGDSPEAFAAYIRADHQKWGRLIRETGIKAE